jgi:hypothetical protein
VQRAEVLLFRLCVDDQVEPGEDPKRAEVAPSKTIQANFFAAPVVVVVVVGGGIIIVAVVVAAARPAGRVDSCKEKHRSQRCGNHRLAQQQ